MTITPRLVLDTNVVVSGLLTRGGPPGPLLRMLRDEQIQATVCEAIIAECRKVLSRSRFPFAGPIAIGAVEQFVDHGLWVFDHRQSDTALVDTSDQPFYDCAYTAACPLVTGNRKHFPDEGPVEVLSPREAVKKLSLPQAVPIQTAFGSLYRSFCSWGKSCDILQIATMVAWMERSGIQGICSWAGLPDFAVLLPGYVTTSFNPRPRAGGDHRLRDCLSRMASRRASREPKRFLPNCAVLP
jgi:putative PIN family toxin of toxin-antitoxin system